MPPVSSGQPADVVDRPESARFWAYDGLRLFAMSCIALRHLMSITAYEAIPLPRFLGLGVITTLSGFLAMKTTSPSWMNSFRKRLFRLYIPYWQVLIIILIANYLTSYKPMSFDLLMSQIAGTAYFTHPGQQIGIHTWFVSLMLVTSVLSVIFRWHHCFLPVVLLWVGCNSNIQSVFSSCVLSFLVGTCLGIYGKSWILAAILVVLFSILGTFVNYSYFYPCAGCMGILITNAAPQCHMAIIGKWGDSTYEFFLLHGPIYLACHRIFGWSFGNILVFGTIIAILSTWLLKKSSAYLIDKSKRVRG